MLLCLTFVAAARQDRAGGASAGSQSQPNAALQKLTTPIPVYIVYKTAWVHDGGVTFLNDLYGYDADQAARLFPASLSGEVTRGLETRR